MTSEIFWHSSWMLNCSFSFFLSLQNMKKKKNFEAAAAGDISDLFRETFSNVEWKMWQQWALFKLSCKVVLRLFESKIIFTAFELLLESLMLQYCFVFFKNLICLRGTSASVHTWKLTLLLSYFNNTSGVRKVQLQIKEDLGQKVTGLKLGVSKDFPLWNFC